MSNKPLTYVSLKTVIQYLDPNTRLLLSSRIPSIRSAERAVPLKIEEILIGNSYIRVNETLYEFELCKMDCKLPYQMFRAHSYCPCTDDKLVDSEIHVSKYQNNSGPHVFGDSLSPAAILQYTSCPLTKNQ
uniref:DUF3794 domain-containing protein n=1 Tax=Caenorhabditis tropicalis TaxID=1561998 RepID=A0A1I7T3T7_9PELO